MSANKLRDRAREHEDLDDVTARPKSMIDELARPHPEVGLSVDPEDLGAWALRSAAQEDMRVGDSEELLSITGEAPSDAAMPGPNFNSIDGVWGQNVDATLWAGAGNLDRERDEEADQNEDDVIADYEEQDEDDDAEGEARDDDDEGEDDEDDEGEDDEDEAELAKRGQDRNTLDYRDNRVHDVSLLDTPTGSGDETTEPEFSGDAGDHSDAEYAAREQGEEGDDVEDSDDTNRNARGDDDEADE
ncbi:MAG: hypothetical protein RL701_7563, partial [Pseudomonadota bacterium]